MPKQNLPPLLDADGVNALLAEAFPQLNSGGAFYRVLEVHAGGCTVRLEAGGQHLRPGGTVSGPALFTLADIGGYALVLSHAGPDSLAVTTNLSINFMRKAGPGALDAHCRILKLGKALMVFDADLVGPDGATIAHATGTYSVPPRRGK